MFSSSIAVCRDSLSVIRKCVALYDHARDLIYGGLETGGGEGDAQADPIGRLRELAPSAPSWRVYDSASALTQLYAAYERFVYDTATTWLGLMPRVYRLYSDLPESVRKQHRVGASRILPKAGTGRYQHLSSDGIVRELYGGVANHHGYCLMIEAFQVHDRNLRGDALNDFLGGLSIAEPWAWISQQRRVVEYMTETRGGQETAEAELRSFIQYRNDAAHGTLENLPGPMVLLGIIDFVEVLAEAIGELFYSHAVEAMAKCGLACQVGEVAERFTRADAVVARMSQITISTGDTLVASAEHYCIPVKIRSMQVDDKDRRRVRCGAGTELGLRFDAQVGKGAKLYRISRSR
ncbi:MAG TPA: MAE_28990/MAE_18760 family HEPN-like nuclease [Armatimonadota bacterium]|jgi:hypothetical protein